eukprot:PDM82008.1 hypothetical protein PRIPAC_36401 [Pristionchus pacificus]
MKHLGLWLEDLHGSCYALQRERREQGEAKQTCEVVGGWAGGIAVDRVTRRIEKKHNKQA